MKRRYGFSELDDYCLLKIDEPIFNGYAVHVKFHNIENPLVVFNGFEKISIKENNYEWIEVYPAKSKYAITIIYDDKGNLIEWYFDVSKQVGMENGVPYEDDLYLDLVILPNGDNIELDEDELLEAFNNGVITQDDVDSAYATMKTIKEKYVNHFDELKELTEFLVNKFKNN